MELQLTPCREWQGSRDVDGYGMIYRGERVKGWRKGRPYGSFRKRVRLNRYLWSLVYGPVPDDWLFLHRCHNPACFRLDHMELAPDLAAQDARRHAEERDARGEGHGMAKLTDDDVRAIREARRVGDTYKVIAERFGISQGNVVFIVKRQTWKHVL
jgi:hypothetical protein